MFNMLLCLKICPYVTLSKKINLSFMSFCLKNKSVSYVTLSKFKDARAGTETRPYAVPKCIRASAQLK